MQKLVHIAVVIKGDGIGPESVDSMLGILSECGFSSEIIMADAGSEQWEKNGRKDPTYIPDSTMDALSSANACFKVFLPNRLPRFHYNLRGETAF